LSTIHQYMLNTFIQVSWRCSEHYTAYCSLEEPPSLQVWMN
jgi:hypothetical protein